MARKEYDIVSSDEGEGESSRHKNNLDTLKNLFKESAKTGDKLIKKLVDTRSNTSSYQRRQMYSTEPNTTSNLKAMPLPKYYAPMVSQKSAH